MALFVALLALPATAAGGAVEDARSHYERGTSLYALGKFAEAAQEYEKAFELKPDPALLYNAAQAQRLAGNKQRALFLYQNFLRVFGTQSPNAAEVQRHVIELRAALAADEANKVAAQKAQAEAAEKRAAEQRAAAQRAAVAPRAPVVTETATARPELTRAAPERTPVYKRWWLWTAVGVAVAAGVGIGVGVALGQPKETTFKVSNP